MADLEVEFSPDFNPELSTFQTYISNFQSLLMEREFLRISFDLFKKEINGQSAFVFLS